MGAPPTTSSDTSSQDRSQAQAQPATLDITAELSGQRILITGATGFIGKVLVEKLLRSVPDVGKLLLLVRPGSPQSAGDRVRHEILNSPIMAYLRSLHAEDWGDWVAEKVEIIAGDLTQDQLGLEEGRYRQLCTRIDRIVASAATVTFDERLDRAFELNTLGTGRMLKLAQDAGDVPLLHVSTCYVSGQREGWIDERLPAPTMAEDEGLDAVLDELRATCQRLQTQGNDDEPFVTAGMELAQRHGFHDVYTFTKSLGERLLARDQRSVPVAIVRPAIVESALTQPIPGWIDAIRVADPLLVAYGRGRTRDIPGVADAPLELIPVDYVAHAILAALANLRPGQAIRGPEEGSDRRIPVYQVGSSRQPITLGELMAHARQGFAKYPLYDDQGQPIQIAEARFVGPNDLKRKLDLRRRTASAGEKRLLDHFYHLIEVYRPYFNYGARYRDDATRALWQRLSESARQTFPFDVANLDWRSYIAEVHVPGIRRFALKAEDGSPPPQSTGSSEGSEPASPESIAASAGNLFELFQAAALAHPDGIALQICRQGQWLRYTYRQALTTTANVAGAMAGRFHIEPGDRVVLWSSGCPEWVLATFAIHRLGAVSVPLDPQWPAEEVLQASQMVGAKLICAAPRLLPSLLELGEATGNVVELAAPLVPEPHVGLLPIAESDTETMGAGAVSSKTRRRGPGSATDSEDLASIIFTSGTTVAPKAVPLTHANYLANVRDLIPLMHLSRERLLSVLPIHHVFEQMVGLLVPMAGGSTFSYVAEIKPAEINWMMNVTRPTVLVAVPRLLELLHGGIMASAAASGLQNLFKVLFTLSKLTGARFGHRLFAKVHQRFGGCLRRIATGGSALEPSLGRSFQLMGFQVAEGYGMTETSPVLTVNPWNGIRFGSAGKPLPGVEFELRPTADAAGTEEGEGEVWVRGANVMSGYYQNPDATEQVMEAGWLNTGDIGSFDRDGYLRLSGRTKDVIVTSAGKNVYPEEVEQRYRDLPGVSELIVLGMPLQGGGEKVCALVVPNPGATDDDLNQIRAAIAALSDRIPSYQQATQVEFWRGELPKTTTMKVKRAVLRDAVLDGQRGDGEASPPAPQAPADQESFSESETWVLETLARLTRTRVDQLSADDRLGDLGVDSLTRVELVGAIEEHFELHLDDGIAGGAARVQDLFEFLNPRR